MWDVFNRFYYLDCSKIRESEINFLPRWWFSSWPSPVQPEHFFSLDRFSLIFLYVLVELMATNCQIITTAFPPRNSERERQRGTTLASWSLLRMVIFYVLPTSGVTLVIELERGRESAWDVFFIVPMTALSILQTTKLRAFHQWEDKLNQPFDAWCIIPAHTLVKVDYD